MKTGFTSKEQATAERKWHIVDGDGAIVGRLASQIAHLLRGKHKANFTPHVDSGDFVVVVNADKVRFTGDKSEKKIYYYHSGYIGGLSDETAGELMARKPGEVLKKAVSGMMPKTALGKNQLKKLKIYAGAEHPHSAQQPEPIELR